MVVFGMKKCSVEIKQFATGKKLENHFLFDRKNFVTLPFHDYR